MLITGRARNLFVKYVSYGRCTLCLLWVLCRSYVVRLRHYVEEMKFIADILVQTEVFPARTVHNGYCVRTRYSRSVPFVHRGYHVTWCCRVET